MVESRNLSVMFTDIKGFTARTSKSTREDLVLLLKKHEEIVLPIARARGGSLIKTIGDAFLFTFATPTDAILGAIEAQMALCGYNASVAEDERIEVRMGINAGEVTEIEGDVFGDAVNIASRIESAAEANEIFFSETVFLTMNKTEIYRSLKKNGLATGEVGFRRLKGVADEVRIYRIYVEGRSPGLRTVELAPTAGPGLVLETDADKPRREGPALELQSLAEFEPESSISLELETTGPVQVPGPGPGLRRQRPARPRPIGARATSDPSRTRFYRPLLALTVLASGAGLLVLAAGVILQSVWIALAGVLCLLISSPMRLGLRHAKMVTTRVVALGLLVLMATVFNATPFKEIQLGLDLLTSEIREQGRKDFGVRDKAALWVMEVLRLGNLWAHGYPEAAHQQLYRLLPADGSHRFASDIAMNSPTVIQPLVEFDRQLRIAWHRGVKEVVMTPVQLKLISARDPPRITAAMPALRLSAKAQRDAAGWAIEASALVPVHCPPPGLAPMIEVSGARVLMEQHLCTLIEDEGWLVSYAAEWVWTLRNDDPRLTIAAGTQ